MLILIRYLVWKMYNNSYYSYNHLETKGVTPVRSVIATTLYYKFGLKLKIKIKLTD